MAKVSIVLFTSKTYVNGMHPVMLRVTKNTKLKYFKVGDHELIAEPKQWNKVNGNFKVDRRLTKKHIIYNDIILKTINKAKQIINDFERNNLPWTLEMFGEKYKTPSRTTNFYSYFLSKIEYLKKSQRFKSAIKSEEVLNILELFDKKIKAKEIADINFKYIEEFVQYLRHERGNKNSTIGINLRDIRSVLNEAIKDGLGSRYTYPFDAKISRGKAFKISSLKTQKVNKYIPKKYMQKFASAEFIEPHLNWAQQLFLFSIYANGVNFKDMAYLTNSDLKNGFDERTDTEIEYIEFARSKTKEYIKFKVNLQLRKILDNLELYKIEGSKYLLPIITRPQHKGEMLLKHVTQRRKRFNMHLKTIVKQLDFPESLQDIGSYHARHTFASLMLKSGSSIEVIKEALAHTNVKTTEAYLSKFGIDEISDKVEGLLE